MSKGYLAACGKPWEDFLTYEPYNQKTQKPRRWNPIKGCRRLEEGRACSAPDGKLYCYMASFIERFDHLDSNFSICPAEWAKLKNLGNVVAFGTAGDPWSYADKPEGMEALISALETMRANPSNLYVCLTKHPAGMAAALAIAGERTGLPRFFLPGLTLDGMDIAKDLNRIAIFAKIPVDDKFIMFEPCFYNRRADLEEVFSYLDPTTWIVVGNLRDKDKKRAAKYQIGEEILTAIKDLADSNGNPVFFKESVKDSILRAGNEHHHAFYRWLFNEKLRGEK